MRWSPEAPGGRPARRSAARSVPGQPVAWRSAHPARRLVPRAPRLPEPREPPPAALRPEQRGRRQRSARQAAARRDVAVAPSSCCRQVQVQQGRPSAALSELARWWSPAAAWCQQPVEAAAAQVTASSSEMKAAVAAESVRPVASAPQARLPAEEAAAASGAKVQPQEAAEVLPGPSARQPVAAEAESAPLAPQPGAAEVALAAGVVLPPEAAGVALDAVAEPQQAGAEAGLPDAEVPRPGVVERPAPVPSVRLLAVEHPSAPPWAYRPGQFLPWLAPRQSARSAHAMRRSRVASPSRQSWRAAGCEGLS
jgi:hypothetical protein